MLYSKQMSDTSYVQTTYGEVMPKKYAGIKVNLECCRCKKIFSKPACQIRPEQKSVYCSRDCMKDPDDVRREKKKANKRNWEKYNRERHLQTSREWKKRNPDKVKQYKLTDWTNNREAYRERYKRYYANNTEKVKKYTKEYYKKNRELMCLKTREWVKKNPERVVLSRRNLRLNKRENVMITSTKMSAKNKNIAFNLTHEWFRLRFQIGACELSGIPFDMVGKKTPNSPSVDRIDPKGGYTIENCRLILWSINRALCNYGQDYLFDVFKKIFERQSAGVG